MLAEHKLKVTVFVVDNGAYGTIRMHQERHYPSRLSATELVNQTLVTWREPMVCLRFCNTLRSVSDSARGLSMTVRQ